VPTQKSPNGAVPRNLTLKAALGRLQRRFEFKLATLKRRLTPDSVHEARTAARRLRALLDGYRTQLSPSLTPRYRNALKRLTRELGTLRDADVARRNIAALARNAHGRHRDALEALSSDFDQRRQRLAGKLQAEMTRSAWSAEVEKLKAAAADAALILPNSLPILAVTRSLLAHRRRRMRSRLRKATRSKTALHRLRIKVKRLRYFLDESSKFGAGLASARELQLLKGLSV
jgi:CHAD domain-containing protein